MERHTSAPNLAAAAALLHDCIWQCSTLAFGTQRIWLALEGCRIQHFAFGLRDALQELAEGFASKGAGGFRAQILPR